jgi:uncharacterized membrane protein YkoI
MLYLAILAALVSLYAALEAKAQSEPERVCFTTAESREKIEAHRLPEPFQLMGTLSSRLHAEAVGVKLCRSREQLIYELSLLRHDGHIIRVSIDAESGQPVGSRSER